MAEKDLQVYEEYIGFISEALEKASVFEKIKEISEKDEKKRSALVGELMKPVAELRKRLRDKAGKEFGGVSATLKNFSVRGWLVLEKADRGEDIIRVLLGGETAEIIEAVKSSRRGRNVAPPDLFAEWVVCEEVKDLEGFLIFRKSVESNGESNGSLTLDEALKAKIQDREAERKDPLRVALEAMQGWLFRREASRKNAAAGTSGGKKPPVEEIDKGEEEPPQPAPPADPRAELEDDLMAAKAAVVTATSEGKFAELGSLAAKVAEIEVKLAALPEVQTKPVESKQIVATPPATPTPNPALESAKVELQRGADAGYTAARDLLKNHEQGGVSDSQLLEIAKKIAKPMSEFIARKGGNAKKGGKK